MIGFDIPGAGDREQARRAIERIGRSVEGVLEETGTTAHRPSSRQTEFEHSR